jgi:hypothetical protein
MRTARTKLVDDAYTAVAASTPRPLAGHPDSLLTTSRRGHDSRSQLRR